MLIIIIMAMTHFVWSQQPTDNSITPFLWMLPLDFHLFKPGNRNAAKMTQPRLGTKSRFILMNAKDVRPLNIDGVKMMMKMMMMMTVTT